ncbi:NADP-dependent phosphogluconate dehydrogenase [Consotaella aegiceratis]|uniref:NADP-dependent phosphogluconate dehydrogenase n=1 Tax=Consotaella aegiceratis TaxID=3097961 RepID=UPI002F40DB2D
MSEAKIGLIGLGTMGAALALNIAEKGFPIAVFNRTTEVTRTFAAEAGPLADRIVPTETLEAFVAAIERPRSIILMVPAGPVVDQQIAALTPLLDMDDLIIDAGNANFHDTERRAKAAADGEIPHFLGIGVSGGEEGARHGPSIMGGGAKENWDRVAPVLTVIAAQYEGQACATLMGERGAGHFVKAVHNGIEYADMQMIAEVYGVMRDGLGLDSDAIADVFARWNEGPLQSYLIEISAAVARARDPGSDKPMLDVILDKAGQKGTGRWTVIEAQHLGAPIPVIEAAVAARNMSAKLESRRTAERAFGPAPQRLAPDVLSTEDLEMALIAGKILCYSQGFGLLSAASTAFEWSLPMPAIAEVWRAGCIIRSSMLNDMSAALREDPTRDLTLAPIFSDSIEKGLPSLRKVVAAGATFGQPLPALSAGLFAFDIMRTARSTANMIQAQRDFFGAHGFERLDQAGTGLHGPWAGKGLGH